MQPLDRTGLKGKALELHHSAIVVDAHVDTILAVAAGERRLNERSAKGHVDLPRLKEGGVNVQIFAHFIEPQYKPDRALPRCIELLDVFFREAGANTGSMTVAKSYEDIVAAIEAGKLAAIISIEGGEALGGRLEVLRMFHRLGVRSLCLTWNERNDIADGVGEWRSAGGLTNFGRQVVQEMNRLGMLIDVSHLAEPGFWDVLAETTSPVIASHSNARAICDHVRNLTDDQIRALAQNGGVMGLNFCPDFIDDRHATIDRIIAHIEHIIDLVGDDHIGLGSDFDGIADTPEGLEDVARLPALTETLLSRGYSETTIKKLLGGNFMRVFREVWSNG